jgi:hypothetical protein
VWRLKTSKSGSEKRATSTLSNYSCYTPPPGGAARRDRPGRTHRTGPIVKGEHGLPVRGRSYGSGSGRSRVPQASPTRCGRWIAAPAARRRRTRLAPLRPAIRADLTQGGRKHDEEIFARRRRSLRSPRNASPTRHNEVQKTPVHKAKTNTENDVKTKCQNRCEDQISKVLKSRENSGRGSRI